MRINISFAAVITLMLILDESGMCAVALFCCIIHEAGHIICLLIFGEKPASVELSFYGIKLERREPSVLSQAEEITVFAAGPAMNLILSAVMFIAGIRTAAVISLYIGMFNLIPCQPLDGGNILSDILNYAVGEDKAEKTCFFVSCITLVPMVFIGIIMIFKNGNFTLAGVTAYLAWVSCIKAKERQ